MSVRSWEMILPKSNKQSIKMKSTQTVDKNNQVFTLNSSNSRRYLVVEYKKKKEKKVTFYSNHVPSGPSCAFRGTFVLCLQENEKTLAA